MHRIHEELLSDTSLKTSHQTLCKRKTIEGSEENSEKISNNDTENNAEKKLKIGENSNRLKTSSEIWCGLKDLTERVWGAHNTTMSFEERRAYLAQPPDWPEAVRKVIRYENDPLPDNTPALSTSVKTDSSTFHANSSSISSSPVSTSTEALPSGASSLDISETSNRVIKYECNPLPEEVVTIHPPSDSFSTSEHSHIGSSLELNDRLIQYTLPQPSNVMQSCESDLLLTDDPSAVVPPSETADIFSFNANPRSNLSAVPTLTRLSSPKEPSDDLSPQCKLTNSTHEYSLTPKDTHLDKSHFQPKSTSDFSFTSSKVDDVNILSNFPNQNAQYSTRNTENNYPIPCKNSSTYNSFIANKNQSNTTNNVLLSSGDDDLSKNESISESLANSSYPRAQNSSFILDNSSILKTSISDLEMDDSVIIQSIFKDGS